MKTYYLIIYLTFLQFSAVFAQFDIEVAKDLNPSFFNKDFTNYNRRTAIYCAQISNIAYEPESAISSYVEVLNRYHPKAHYKIEFIQDVETSTEVVLFGNTDFLIVAFRGTQEGEDFKTDSKFWAYKNKVDSSGKSEFKNLPTGHGGFRRSLMNLMDTSKYDIFRSIELFITDSLNGDTSNFPIYLTGHSLGGALSSMFIRPLKGAGFNYSGGYNFAPPLAIWNSEAKKIIEDSTIFNVTYDIVNNTDYITRVPKYSRNKYSHIGQFYRICSNNTQLKPLIFRENEVFYKYKWGEKLMLKKALFDKYHRMNHYILGVKNIQNTDSEINERSLDVKNCSCLVLKNP